MLQLQRKQATYYYYLLLCNHRMGNQPKNVIEVYSLSTLWSMYVCVCVRSHTIRRSAHSPHHSSRNKCYHFQLFLISLILPAIEWIINLMVAYRKTHASPPENLWANAVFTVTSAASTCNDPSHRMTLKLRIENQIAIILFRSKVGDQLNWK